MISDLSARCSQNQNGRRFIHVSVNGFEATIPVELWVTKQSEAVSALINKGVVAGRSGRKTIEEAIETSDWPVKRNFDLPGWTDGQFALGSGRVIHAADAPLPVAFTPHPGAWASAGSLESYKTELLKRLSKQRIFQFCIGTAFVGPLLGFLGVDENPVFDLHGPTSIGKSTAQKAAASVWGPTGGTGEHYWTTWNTTGNSLERQMESYSGALIVLDESNLFTSSQGKTAGSGAVSNAVFALAQGHDKGRLNGPAPRHKRFVVLSSSNEALSNHLTQAGKKVSDAALVRLISIPAERRFGVFSRKLRDGSRPAEFIQTLNAAMGRNHGTAGPAFVQALVEDHAASPERLIRKLRSQMERFLRRSGAIGDPAAERAARAFGAVYAALELARAYEVIPNSWSALRIVLDAYQRYRKALGAPPSALVLLRRYVERTTLKVSSPKSRLPQGTRVADLPGVLWLPVKDRKLEFLVSRARVQHIFGDKARGLQVCRAAGVLVTDGGRGRTLQTKRRIAEGGGAERLLCFDLDALAASLTLDSAWLRARSAAWNGEGCDERGRSG